mgnify:CR=1 FL=1
MNETEKRDRRDEKEEIRYHVIFYGQVQGVGFRYRAYYAAYQLGLTGWVRNCWDETVEMEVQGDEETITEMIKRIRTSSYIEITDAKWTKIPLESEFGFHIRWITKSSPWQKKPQNFTGPGRTSPVRCPVFGLNSTSIGQPSVLQVQILITSFWRRSTTRMRCSFLQIPMEKHMR